MSLGDVKKLSQKDVEKYYYRYQSMLGKQVTGGMVESTIKLFSRFVSLFHVVNHLDLTMNEKILVEKPEHNAEDNSQES